MRLNNGNVEKSPLWCWFTMLAIAAVTLPGAALAVGSDEKSGKSSSPEASPPKDQRMKENEERERDPGESSRRSDLQRDRSQHQSSERARLTILGPTIAGEAIPKLDPPHDHQILKSLSRHDDRKIAQIPAKERWSGVRIIKEKIVSYTDPPRFFPLIGSAQLHHTHYVCTIYFDPHAPEKVEQVHVHYQHFHLVPAE